MCTAKTTVQLEQQFDRIAIGEDLPRADDSHSDHASSRKYLEICVDTEHRDDSHAYVDSRRAPEIRPVDIIGEKQKKHMHMRDARIHLDPAGW